MNYETNVNMNTVRTAILGSGYKRGGFTYAEIPLDMLNVRPIYQRMHGEKHVNDLVHNWDDRLCDDVLVSDRDGEFNVIDGQTRCMAARQLGKETIGCKVVRGLTLEQEAMVFAEQANCVKRLNQTDSHKAKLIAQDESALGVQEVCDKNGVIIGSTSAANLRAVSTATMIYRKYGAEWLDRIFRTIEAVGWKDCRAGYNNTILRALISVYDNTNRDMHDEVMREIVHNLRGITPQMALLSASEEYAGRPAAYALGHKLLDMIKSGNPEYIRYKDNRIKVKQITLPNMQEVSYIGVAN